MSKHTPGPWTAYCRDIDHKEGEAWSEDKFLQWEVSGPRVPDGRGEYYESDARLIAAAPGLLDVLQEIVHMWDHHCNAHGDGTPSPLHVKARVAIAKATGEAT